MATLGAGRQLNAALFWLLMTVNLIACTWPGPHLQHNTAVDEYFNSFQVYPQYQYYTADTLKDPRAILALKPGYTLDSPGWQAVDMNPQLLESWISAFKKDSLLEGNLFPDGANVVSHNGELVGYFYSAWVYPVVRVPKAMTVAIAVPQDEYRPNNEKVLDLLSGDDGVMGNY